MYCTGGRCAETATETVPDSVWERTRSTRCQAKTPWWALDLVGIIWTDQLARVAERQSPPYLVFVRPRSKKTFGGRWFPGKHSRLGGECIAIFAHSDFELTRGTLVHEMGHVLRNVRAGDPVGEHDKAFLTLVKKLYKEYAVPVEVAKIIERESPQSASWRW